MKRSIWLLVALVILAVAAPADATFPGSNGKILYYSGDGAQWRIINPNGTGDSEFPSGGEMSDPDWSPDGSKIAFTASNGIWVMNSDGTGRTNVVAGSAAVLNYEPSWSPDGSRIAYTKRTGCSDPSQILMVNAADGSNPVPLQTSFASVGNPRWHPSGTRIAFIGSNASSDPGCSFGAPHIVDLDGTNEAPLPAPSTSYDFSPDGTKVVYSVGCGLGGEDCPRGYSELFTANLDGSDVTNITNSKAPHHDMTWSPDGTKIAVARGTGPGLRLVTLNADGSGGLTQINDRTTQFPVWQPIPVNSYARPKGATPSRFSLVPAYSPCISSNRTHGPPLAFPSCQPPVPNSPYLAIGTPDVNGTGARFIGSLRTDVIAGNPGTPADEADVGLQISTIDVRCSPTGPPATCGAANYSSVPVPDYTGELEAIAFLRITDKDNTPNPDGPGAATVEDFDLRVTVPCSGTASDDMVGSTCAVATTVDALMPGAVKEGRRAIWELDRVHVRDGGPDGVAATADNRVFARAGLFVP